VLWVWKFLAKIVCPGVIRGFLFCVVAGIMN
jgi:hypothetical protein